LKKLIKQFSKVFVAIIWLSTLDGCVEPYVQSFRTSNKIIIVEGLLSNDSGLRPIILKESLPSASGSSNITLIQGAKVSVVVNGGAVIQLNEKEEGTYYFDSNFKGEIGSTYQLKFTTTDGKVYESKVEKLLAPVAIEKVSHQLDLKAISDAKGNTSVGYNLYVDIQDPANASNQYLWEWTLYEKQNVCKTCTGGYYYRTPAPYGACVTDALLSRYNNIFDYTCESGCWEIVRSTDLIVNNDELSNGKLIKNQYVGKMPVFQYSGALLDVSQYTISKEAYNFIRLSQKQGVETGGLADTPPAALIGNVSCVSDPSINTSGFFIVAGKTKAPHWLDKQDAFDQKAITVGLLGGRGVKLEPSGPNTTRPPLAPCVNSASRTNQEPKGWIN
jgi:Domain of unknown function (DUF4249)